jgi:hypothetical protein
MNKAISILLCPSAAAGILIASILSCGARETNSTPKVTIAELLKNKELWKGKRIEVSGFYVTGFEISALYENEHDAKSVRDEKGLWVDYYDEVASDKSKLRWVERGFIRIIGTFDFRADSGSGYLNQWPARVRRIELVEPIPRPAKPKRKARSYGPSPGHKVGGPRAKST